MNYQEAKTFRDNLESAVKEASVALGVFPKGNMGLTPDAVRNSTEYKSTKALFDARFARLREFNGKFVVQFAKEIRAERRNRK